MMSDQQRRAEKALEQRARRKARSVGLVAIKSRKGLGSINNRGGFMLVDEYFSIIKAGKGFDMSAEDVIAYCSAE